MGLNISLHSVFQKNNFLLIFLARLEMKWLYRSSVFLFHRIPLCKLINQHLSALANKFPDVKFLKSVSSVCIPNYPDKNLPTIFVYYEGDLKKQYVGPLVFGGMNFKQDGKKNQSTDGESTDWSWMNRRQTNWNCLHVVSTYDFFIDYLCTNLTLVGCLCT